jgi:GDSL-like lipase/acylhydrolase family protein
MKRAARWLANAVMVAVALTVTLAVVEVGLRHFYPQPMGVWHQDRDGLALHWPGLVTYLPQFGQSVSFNSAGMRDREHAVVKPAGAFRVLVLGDSFIEALQVPFEDSFPSLLQRELAARAGRPVEVINASVSGWGTDDELQYLTSYGRRWKPDLVVVAMTLYNDVNDNLRQRFHTIKDGALIDTPRAPASSLDFKLTELKGFLATRFHMWQVVIRAKRARETRAEAQQLHSHVDSMFSRATDARMSRGLELTRLLVERMHTIASGDGSRVVLVLIPLGVQLSDKQFAEFAAADAGTTPQTEIDRPQREMKQIGQRAGVDVIDLLPGFREWAAAGGDALYLARDGHWDRPGHRLAAKITSAELVRLGAARR